MEDAATGPNLTDEKRTEFTDLAKQFLNLFLLKHQAPQTSFGIIFNSPQTNRLDQDLTQYLIV